MKFPLVPPVGRGELLYATLLKVLDDMMPTTLICGPSELPVSTLHVWKEREHGISEETQGSQADSVASAVLKQYQGTCTRVHVGCGLLLAALALVRSLRQLRQFALSSFTACPGAASAGPFLCTVATQTKDGIQHLPNFDTIDWHAQAATALAAAVTHGMFFQSAIGCPVGPTASLVDHSISAQAFAYSA